jgi:hypothetical protein
MQGYQCGTKILAVFSHGLQKQTTFLANSVLQKCIIKLLTYCFNRHPVIQLINIIPLNTTVTSCYMNKQVVSVYVNHCVNQWFAAYFNLYLNGIGI